MMNKMDAKSISELKLDFNKRSILEPVYSQFVFKVNNNVVPRYDSRIVFGHSGGIGYRIFQEDHEQKLSTAYFESRLPKIKIESTMNLESYANDLDRFSISLKMIKKYVNDIGEIAKTRNFELHELDSQDNIVNFKNNSSKLKNIIAGTDVVEDEERLKDFLIMADDIYEYVQRTKLDIFKTF